MEGVILRARTAQAWSVVILRLTCVRLLQAEVTKLEHVQIASHRLVGATLTRLLLQASLASEGTCQQLCFCCGLCSAAAGVGGCF